jgi:uncharacterized protein
MTQQPAADAKIEGELSERDLRAAIQRLLQAQTTATIATMSPAGPWAAAVFYASDPELRLYFVSDPRTRHGRDLAADHRAAATVHADCASWRQIRGLQIDGRVTLLDGPERAEGMALYLARFPEVQAMTEGSGDSDEQRIARRLEAAALYRLTPVSIRLIDNTRGFGFRETLVLLTAAARRQVRISGHSG